MESTGITGQFYITLDEKGRLMLPSKLRLKLNTGSLVLTKSVDSCLWLFPTEPWHKLVETLMMKKSLFNDQYQQIYRRLIAPAEEVFIDKNGRIKINSSLMKSAHLKRESILIGMDDHIELWDKEIYEAYEASCALSVKEGWGQLASMVGVEK